MRYPLRRETYSVFPLVITIMEKDWIGEPHETIQ
jgi:hypothetical protein